MTLFHRRSLRCLIVTVKLSRRHGGDTRKSKKKERKGALVKEMRARVESHSECAGNRAQGK